MKYTQLRNLRLDHPEFCDLDQVFDITENDQNAMRGRSRIQQRLIDQGIELSEAHEQILGEIASAVTSPMKNRDEIAVIAADCGMGKTSAIIALAQELTEDNPNMGIIIGVERNEDAVYLQSLLTGKAIARFSFMPQSCLRGQEKYNRQVCRGCTLCCEKKAAQKNHQFFPILIVTHAYLVKQTLYGERLGDSAYYIDSFGVKHKRQILLIDEKLPMALNKDINEESLYLVNEAMQKIITDTVLGDEARKLMHYTREINKEITDIKQGICILPPLDTKFRLSKEMKRYFFRDYEDEDLLSLGLVVSVIRKGGIVQYKEFSKKRQVSGKIFTVDYLEYNFGLKTIIFDGTASVDLEYQSGSFRIIKTPKIRNYSNLILNNCPMQNLSRSKLVKNEKPIDPKALLDDMSEIAANEMLLLTYKEHEEDFDEMVNMYKEKGRIIHVDHFGNLKGKNLYSQADMMLIYGLPHRSDAYYVAKATSLGIKVDNTEAVYMKQEGRRYENEDLQMIFESEMLVDLLQSIFRSKIRRNSNDMVQVYFFIQHRSLAARLKEYFLGCKLQQWYPRTFCCKYMHNDTERDQRILALIQFVLSYFQHMPAGMGMSKKQLKDALKYKDQDTLGADLKNEFVRTILEQFGIKVEYHKLTKTEGGWSYEDQQKIS